jgi:COMPASS component SWD3
MPSWSMGHAPTGTCEGHEGVVSAIRYSEDGSLIATSSADCTARVWTAGRKGTGQLRQTFTGHDCGISDICWHPNQPYLATASDDKSLGLWDLESGERIQSFQGHTHFVFCCKFHTLGSVLVWAKSTGAVTQHNKAYSFPPTNLADLKRY